MSEMLTSDPTLEERKAAYEQADRYLSEAIQGDEFDPNIADSDGFVTYINGTSNEPPADLVQERKEVSRVLEGLGGIITSAALQAAGEDEKARHDPKLWEDPLRYGLGPFTSGMATSVTTYKRKVVGLEIATQFLNILLDAVAEEGLALQEFQKFLTAQGESISIEGEDSKEGYRYACLGLVHELFQVENEEWIYVPKIKLYFTSFTRETFKVTSFCASVEKVDFDFTVEKVSAPFRLETWRQDEEFRERVEGFIKKYDRAQVQQSENYFDGIFKSVKG
jgi:Virulence factor Evf